MDFIATPLGVFIILGIVVAAAFLYEPAKLTGAWRELSELYVADRRPRSTPFKNEDVEIGTANFARIDAALDDEGFWLLPSDPQRQKAPECLLVPWDCIRYRRMKGEQFFFELRGKGPIAFLVSPELGAALQRRSIQFDAEDPL